MAAILGISAFYHDSAAALVVDGKIIAAAQEERFTRKKHDESFPENAISYCLNEAKLTPAELDYVGFYDKPMLKFDRLLQTYTAYAPQGFWSFAKAMPQWLKQKLHLPKEIRKGLGGKFRKRIAFAEHHESHAASAFFPSPFDEAAILTVDGVGEWATASFGTGSGNRIQLSHELRFPHSLGMLYSAMTYYCGFKVNSGEYKLMGLAPYGQPVYIDQILDKLIDLKEDGSFRMDMSYFNYCQGLTMTSSRFHDLFGGLPRQPESKLTQREMDLAASVQLATEEIMLRMARHVHRQTGMKNLCLAGGVALNCVANGRLLREGPFERIWIQPAAGDAGGALGVALFIAHQMLNHERVPHPVLPQAASALGPEFDRDSIRNHLDSKQAVYTELSSNEELCQRVAQLIDQGNVVGWMQGRMEFGPRALGNRSILGDPRNREMQSKMNLKIKFRESFRPFAPSVLQEQASEYFDFPSDQESPYMLLVADVAEARRLPVETSSSVQGFDLLKQIRSEISAITHVDYSARLQTVDQDRHPLYHQLISEFHAQTGCPLLINTSFNVRGEPIVCTPEDAYRCFMGTNMDVLVVGQFLLLKEEQPEQPNRINQDYIDQFELD
ncbi:Decarbamoylnovobiocin carbamoyltransferase [Thalassoglobus neptunius]|uniref:Decarbamoylnovobiocin carbamoyltransferase n=1 Tax=Thalassoglobus neptunius TaxID=1938619 RepID=A0A5C5X6V1_9PLAN|nr:carbamoyltransferase [Thalassoglobus neptunius]TWT58498.1 Decarbamoylnovobiocin carbamoyltransferase [Thalassoglobus neptunius]